jgi:hypothetical protein
MMLKKLIHLGPVFQMIQLIPNLSRACRENLRRIVEAAVKGLALNPFPLWIPDLISFQRSQFLGTQLGVSI